MSTESTDETDDDGMPRRRRLLGWLAGLSIVTFILSIATPLKDLALAVGGTDRRSGGGGGDGGDDGGDEQEGLPGQRLVLAEEFESASAGDPVTVDLLEPPHAVRTFPEQEVGTDNQLIILHKFDEADISEPTNLDWVEQGFVAYSAVCTHLGCAVNWTEEAHEVGGPHDHCPCHIAEFDPLSGAEVLAGPAPRPLPQIGVTVNDNDEIELSSEFEERVGGE